MVFQDYALLPWRTARDNIGMGLKIRGVPKDEQRRVAESYVNMFGLGGFADKYPHELSGGMRQRVAVARTLANSPQVILMDEPFAAVDAQTRAVLGEEFAAITASRLMTVMLVTHSVEEAVFLGDRVLIMSPRPGRVDSMLEVPLKRSERNWDSVRENSTFIQLTREASQIIRSFDVGLRRQ
jgi:NitT/TauT family transport system ATP-binding protein